MSLPRMAEHNPKEVLSVCCRPTQVHHDRPANRTRRRWLSSTRRRMLTEAKSLDDIKAVRDKAGAVQHYARSATLGLALQNQAAEIKLLAERKAGRLLAALQLHGGDRRSRRKADSLNLKELGISNDQSARWQREASVPEELYVRYIRDATAQGYELTSAGLLRLARSGRNHTSCPRRSNEGFEHLLRCSSIDDCGPEDLRLHLRSRSLANERRRTYGSSRQDIQVGASLGKTSRESGGSIRSLTSISRLPRKQFQKRCGF